MVTSKRDIKSAVTKKRIKSTALKLMRKYSIEEISVNEICSQANVGIGTFYHYYKKKDDIILEVFDEMDIYFTRLFKSSAVKELTPYEYVIQHCSVYAKFIVDTGVEFTKKVYSLQSNTILNNSRPIYSTLFKYLDMQKQNNVIDPELDIEKFIRMIMVCLRGTAYDWCIHDGNYDLIEQTVFYAENMIANYKPLLENQTTISQA